MSWFASLWAWVVLGVVAALAVIVVGAVALRSKRRRDEPLSKHLGRLEDEQHSRDARLPEDLEWGPPRKPPLEPAQQTQRRANREVSARKVFGRRTPSAGRQAPGAPAPSPEQGERTSLASFAASALDPDPSTPKGALEIEAGRLAYQIPNRMWVGVQETVEVRLGAVIAKEIMQGFVGRGDIKQEHVPIVETMSVSLVCEPGAFDIEPRSQEVQLVKRDVLKGTGFHQDDFAKWIWLVTPRETGKHTLLVKVSAALKDSRGLPTTASLPDKIIAVTVRVHIVRATVGAVRYAAPGLAWAIVTALVGVFTKDYWWPAVRDFWWPAVRAMVGMQ